MRFKTRQELEEEEEEVLKQQIETVGFQMLICL